MKPCPYCGESLVESLVDSIVDPHQEESCPKGPRPALRLVPTVARPVDDRPLLIAAFGFDVPEDAA